ncbi:MAG: glycoside hydrolase family 32 protein [Verrucomicrobia bacterium]|nr:glycoside hydrolase family 32 protein [Verrucomicrobiota bacterium]
MKQIITLFIITLFSPIAGNAFAGEPDILIADFEDADYGEWKATGRAFGPAPAKGTLPGQMQVEGFKGERLVNSYYEGDGTTGVLTSSPIKIQRKYINFLIGGGGYAGETCVNLLLNGEIVRTATGTNTSPGGSEELSWYTWDVSDLKGSEVVVQIVDNHTGGWGHINVDHIVQSDSRKTVAPGELSRRLTLENNYLNLPVKNGAPMRRMELRIKDRPVRAFDIELAPDSPDWWAYIDVRPFRGKEAVLKVDAMTPGSHGLALVEQANKIKGATNLYDEPLRPQFHFSQKRGWNNDPNGMVYYDGEYHLFFQHNPYGWNWGNMHWGHAVSKDLVRWKQLPDVLYPWTQAKAHCFSGSAVVDRRNTAGFQTGDEKVIVAAFTDTGCGEALAYSNDRGRHFTYYEGNPVVEHEGRDPKIIWYKPKKHWVMAVYDEREGSRAIAFYTSPNLKDWEFQSRLEGYFECPEIFELPVDGDKANTRWVVYGADAKYAIGRFNGKTFIPEHEGKYQAHWGDYYASQTFSGTPDGRRIQIGWGRINMEGMPFNQMMTFPCRLTLRSTDDGIRMFAEPVEELELLHRRKHARHDIALKPDAPASISASGRLFDIRAVFDVGESETLGLQIGETKVIYNTAQEDLMGMPLKPVNGKISIQILVDRPSMEICGNDGRVYQTRSFRSESEISGIEVFVDGGRAELDEIKVYELDSIWPK